MSTQEKLDLVELELEKEKIKVEILREAIFSVSFEVLDNINARGICSKALKDCREV